MRSSIPMWIDESPALQPPRKVRTLALRFRAEQPQSVLSPGQQAFEIVPPGLSTRSQEAAVKANSHPPRNSLFRIRSQIAQRHFVIREYYPAMGTRAEGPEFFYLSRGSSFLLFSRNDR